MKTAPEILTAAAAHIADRATSYDAPQGERSAAKTAAAFNAVTGHNLTAGDVYLLLAVLKMVRARQGAFKQDNYEDGAAYFALAGEADQPLPPVDRFAGILTPPEKPSIMQCQCGQMRTHSHTCKTEPNVFWSCSHCHHQHQWRWDAAANDTGPIGMICDKCGKETACTSSGDGIFRPAPAEPNVRWLCSNCGQYHAWTMDLSTTDLSIPIAMTCERCGKKANYRHDGNGCFIARP